ncbi:MAG: hypothetical protein H0X66_18560 [Verrucomicrobia bacterium]|nr:hypothetical protein [Verrucomicrobiota bacterium]
MIPIKIECGCGQPYAFEIEPFEGRMPHAIACPTCGMDGTVVANEIFAQKLPAPVPVALPVGGVRLRAAVPVKSSAPSAQSVSNIIQKERSQVDHEARARIFWGDEPDAVIKFIMTHGVGYEEASKVVGGFARERAAITRVSGIKKIVIGSLLVAIPVVAFFIFASIGFFPIKIFGVTVAIGLFGGYLLLTGTMMLVAPKIESGDVADL